MLRLSRIVITALLFTIVAVCLALVIVPPFLDRIYYRGAVSDHFNGERFFNPEGQRAFPTRRSAVPFNFTRYLSVDDGRVPWPTDVPVRQTVPPRSVAGEAMRVTWIGHATVLVQTQGLNILTDPAWSEYSTPFPPLGPKRTRAPGVRIADLPKIDLILVSHNHYDHLDLPTLGQLWERDRPLIVTPLGNDTIMEQTGVKSVARDWGGRVAVKPGIDVIVERVHHWSSRWGKDRNRALWAGFTVTLPGGNLFFPGDTGVGDMAWAKIAATRGPIRLALLPIGAYRPLGQSSGNHLEPDAAVEVFEALKPSHALAIHWGTFQLAYEGMWEAPETLRKDMAKAGIAAARFRVTEPGEQWVVPVAAGR